MLRQAMTIALSGKDFEDLWDQNNSKIQYVEPQDDSDIIYSVPERLGIGTERWIELRGIDLLLINEIYHDDLRIHSPGEEDRCIEFGFNLAGTFAHRCGGHNFLQWGLSDSNFYEVVGREPILKVDVHLASVDVLRSFVPGDLSLLPPLLKTLIEEGSSSPYDDLGIITPAMKLALEQIIHCPYQGLTKRIYLEAKCLELIALKLDQLTQSLTGNRLVISLKPEDVSRIYHAKDILTQNLNNPPSLLALAKQVGLNDCTLKRGFRQIFGTTAFGYLHQCRMDQAKMLLLEQNLSVNQVAQTIGYASRSAFTVAFRKRFGVTPGAIASGDSV
jgi:AraC family transcriptional regulator, transcriptional activator of the genes for pyochelin and ferripyochelin receptors